MPEKMIGIRLRKDNEMASVNPPKKLDQKIKHREELAQQLIRRLGFAGARQTCVENHWEGVLEAINTVGAR
tara:strand:+ start:7286 stop:7498 length:213 start_codon:yes stop_codon:yes gene_type:complete